MKAPLINEGICISITIRSSKEIRNEESTFNDSRHVCFGCGSAIRGANVYSVVDWAGSNGWELVTMEAMEAEYTIAAWFKRQKWPGLLRMEQEMRKNVNMESAGSSFTVIVTSMSR